MKLDVVACAVMRYWTYLALNNTLKYHTLPSKRIEKKIVFDGKHTPCTHSDTHFARDDLYLSEFVMHGQVQVHACVKKVERFSGTVRPGSAWCLTYLFELLCLVAFTLYQAAP